MSEHESSDRERTEAKQSIECPCCYGRRAITVLRDRRCGVRGCDELAVWDYHNEISGTDKDLCNEHLENLRRDVHVREWVESGFAQRIEP